MNVYVKKTLLAKIYYGKNKLDKYTNLNIYQIQVGTIPGTENGYKRDQADD
jgi:hypothetical protein